MRQVGIREFKTHVTAMLAGGETLVIERHGTPVGFFIPIEAVDRERGRAAMGRLADVLHSIATRIGLDEEQIAREITDQA